jgi:hypothetical protein
MKRLLLLLAASTVEAQGLDSLGAIPLNLGDDNSALVQLGFTFNYFNQPFTQAWVSSNGFVSFSTGQDLCCNGEPINNAPQNTIFGMWTDLISNGNPYIKSTNIGGVSIFTAGWYNTMEYRNNRSQTFQITLDSTDTFIIRYGNTTNFQNHTALAGYTSPNDSHQIYYGSQVGSLSNQTFSFSPVVEDIPPFEMNFGFDLSPEIQTFDIAQVPEIPVENITTDPIDTYEPPADIIDEEIIQELASEIDIAEDIQEEVQEILQEEIEEAEAVEEVIAEAEAAEVTETTNGDLSLSEILALIGEATGESHDDAAVSEMLVPGGSGQVGLTSILGQASSFTQSQSQSQGQSQGQSQTQGQSGGFGSSFEQGLMAQDFFSQTNQSGSGSIFGTGGYTTELAQTATDAQTGGVLGQQSQNDILTLMARPVVERERENAESEIAGNQAETIADINSTDISAYTRAAPPTQPEFYSSPSPYRRSLPDNNLRMYQMSNDAVWEQLRSSQYER